MSALGNRIPNKTKDRYERDQNPNGYIEGDTPILKELGIMDATGTIVLKNSQGEPFSAEEIRIFLNYIADNAEEYPLPQILRCILEDNLQQLRTAVKSFGTADATRSYELLKIKEIERILLEDTQAGGEGCRPSVSIQLEVDPQSVGADASASLAIQEDDPELVARLQRCKELEAELEALKKAKAAGNEDEKTKRIAELEKELEKTKGDLKSAEERATKALEDFKAFQKTVEEEKEKALEEARAQALRAAKAASLAAQVRLDQLIRERDALVAQHEADIIDAEQRVEEARAAARQAQAQADTRPTRRALDEAREALAAAQRTAEEDAALYAGQIQAANAELQATQAALEQLQQQQAEAAAHQVQLQAELQTANEQVTAAEHKKNAAEQELIGLRNQLALYDAVTQGQQATLTEKESALDRANAELAAAKEAQSSMRARLEKELDDSLAKLLDSQTLNQEHQAALDAMRGQLVAAEAAIRRKTEELTQLSIKSEEQERELAECYRLKEELEKAKEQLAQLQQGFAASSARFGPGDGSENGNGSAGSSASSSSSSSSGSSSSSSGSSTASDSASSSSSGSSSSSSGSSTASDSASSSSSGSPTSAALPPPGRSAASGNSFTSSSSLGSTRATATALPAIRQPLFSSSMPSHPIYGNFTNDKESSQNSAGVSTSPPPPTGSLASSHLASKPQQQTPQLEKTEQTELKKFNDAMEKYRNSQSKFTHIKDILPKDFNDIDWSKLINLNNIDHWIKEKEKIINQLKDDIVGLNMEYILPIFNEFNKKLDYVISIKKRHQPSQQLTQQLTQQPSEQSVRSQPPLTRSNRSSGSSNRTRRVLAQAQAPLPPPEGHVLGDEPLFQPGRNPHVSALAPLTQEIEYAANPNNFKESLIQYLIQNKKLKNPGTIATNNVAKTAQSYIIDAFNQLIDKSFQTTKEMITPNNSITNESSKTNDLLEKAMIIEEFKELVNTIKNKMPSIISFANSLVTESKNPFHSGYNWSKLEYLKELQSLFNIMANHGKGKRTASSGGGTRKRKVIRVGTRKPRTRKIYTHRHK